ncbi:hypothetical protein GC209_15610 [bacterium]|nr:hypothetical protein [bacterium]
MKTSHALALVPFLMASTAMADTATQDGADHLAQVFQTYLGATEGVVAVAPNGDSYDLTLDPTPLIELGKDQGMTGTVTPLELSLTDNGDGTWAVSMDQAISIAVAKAGAFDVKEDIGQQTLEGTFDEKLMTFSKLSGTFSGVKLSQTMQTPDGKSSAAEVAIDKGTIEATATAGASGGADTVATLSASGLSETITTPGADGQPGMPMSVKAEGVSETLNGTGFVFDGIYKTVAWVVAHPDEASKKADKAGLKSILSEAMPFFANLSGTGTVTKLSVDTPMGMVGLDEISFTADINGAVADGKFRESISLSGLTLPPGLVPAWAAPILPAKLSIDAQVTDFDAAAGLTTALDYLDLPDGMADTTALDAKLKAAFLPKNTVTITLNPGGLSGDGYQLTYEGSMVAGPDMPIPTGTAKVTLAGADKLQAALNNAPDDIKGQAMMGFGMAQGMAKKDASGNLEWDIDATKPGSVSVNGTPMMGGN